MLTMRYLIVIVVKVLLLCSAVKSEVYSSVKEVEKLIMTHKSVTAKLMSYVADENKRLKIVENYIKTFTEEQERADVDVQKYVANPINSFTLIKRLYTDFEYLKNLNSGSSEINWDEELVYPSKRDFSGAATAIGRLQDVYNLSSTQLLAGRQNISSLMTADDCYKLASQLYSTKDYRYAAEWFEEAYHKMTDDEDLTFTRTDVMKQIIKSHHHRNPALDTTAYEWAVKLYELESNEDEIDPAVKPYYKKIEAVGAESTDDVYDLYPKLCRGDIGVSTSNASKLHCSYLRRGSYLNLAPVKMEQLHREPDVFLFHDVLSDEEIDTLKDLANPELRRAVTIKNDDTVGIETEGRVGKLAWLNGEKYDIVSTVQRRTADFTGLDMTTAEDLQVLNYGIGGQYDLHYDALGPHENIKLIMGVHGNRIATILFYMSDVEEGGATVFPSLRVAVRPKKGTALFWLNLNIEGDRDDKTMHAACPVLYGSKWVGNYWLHRSGQELLHQCPVQRTFRHFGR